jgi:hypothetical protein
MTRSTSQATLCLSLAAAILSPVIVLMAADRVQVVRNDADTRVDVLIDGKPFTSYIYPGGTEKKPTLYPIRSAKGSAVTRGYPMEPRPGESRDHPHHVGFWFNYGDVNGIDFWNNSSAINPAQAARYGTVVHKRIVEAKGGASQGELAVEAEWVKSDGTPLLKEETRFIFRGDQTTRSIERITTLTALAQKVTFTDNKEGVVGLRVARGLQQPAVKPEIVTGPDGKATPAPVLDNTGVTGNYTSSEGLQGDKVWGTRAKWTMLTGTADGGEAVTLALLDHPSNPGYPTYWHARGYGLFAANPLGQKAMSNGKDELNLALEPGKSATFRYRLLILGGTAAADAVERESKAFAAVTGSK